MEKTGLLLTSSSKGAERAPPLSGMAEQPTEASFPPGSKIQSHLLEGSQYWRGQSPEGKHLEVALGPAVLEESQNYRTSRE